MNIQQIIYTATKQNVCIVMFQTLHVQVGKDYFKCLKEISKLYMMLQTRIRWISANAQCEILPNTSRQIPVFWVHICNTQCKYGKLRHRIRLWRLPNKVQNNSVHGLSSRVTPEDQDHFAVFWICRSADRWICTSVDTMSSCIFKSAITGETSCLPCSKCERALELR